MPFNQALMAYVVGALSLFSFMTSGFIGNTLIEFVRQDMKDKDFGDIGETEIKVCIFIFFLIAWPIILVALLRKR